MKTLQQIIDDVNNTVLRFERENSNYGTGSRFEVKNYQFLGISNEQLCQALENCNFSNEYEIVQSILVYSPKDICEHCQIEFDMEDGFTSVSDAGIFCCEDCAIAAGYEYCNECGEWGKVDDGIYIKDFFLCCQECIDTYTYNNETELALPSNTEKELATYYLSCMLELADDVDNEERDTLEDLYTSDFTERAWQEISEHLQAFNLRALAIGFDILDLDAWTRERLAYDLCLECAGHGVGFSDRPEIYGKEYAEKLHDIAATMRKEKHVFAFELNGKMRLEFE